MKQKLFLTSVIAILCSANAWAEPCPFPFDSINLDQGMYYKGDGWTEMSTPAGTVQTCLSGHYCPGVRGCAGTIDVGIYSCPENYDNTATGLKTIEECCLNGYDSSTGLCNEGASAFPSNGLMQENKTYANAATETNMDGVYSGTVNAVAEYDFINYVLSAGQYLPKDSETITTCPVGSFCSGIGSVQYDEENDQGLTSCPTIDDATFTSVAGSSAVTACYQENTAKSSAELNPFTTAHLNTSKNTDGYINGVKYKSATTAARRYATSATTAGEWAALDESDLAITGLACENGYHYKAGTTAPNLTSLIGITEAGDDYVSNDSAGEEYDSYNSMTSEGAGISGDPLAFAVDYGNKGIIKGHGRCSTRSATDPWVGTGGTYVLQSDGTTATLPDSSGQYCYCQLDSYTPVGGSATALSAPWVFYNVFSVADDCAYDCASICASNLLDGSPVILAFRAAVFGSLGASPAMCEANTITINWSNAEQTDIDANNAGTATYGEDVRTPVKAETIKGKTFLGWKFSKPEQTPLP